MKNALNFALKWITIQRICNEGMEKWANSKRWILSFVDKKSNQELINTWRMKNVHDVKRRRAVARYDESHHVLKIDFQLTGEVQCIFKVIHVHSGY